MRAKDFFKVLFLVSCYQRILFEAVHIEIVKRIFHYPSAYKLHSHGMALLNP